jgi:hypothetical protein
MRDQSIIKYYVCLVQYIHKISFIIKLDFYNFVVFVVFKCNFTKNGSQSYWSSCKLTNFLFERKSCNHMSSFVSMVKIRVKSLH